MLNFDMEVQRSFAPVMLLAGGVGANEIPFDLLGSPPVVLLPPEWSLFVEPVLLVVLVIEGFEFYDLLKNFVSFLRGLEELFLHAVVLKIDSPVGLVVIGLRYERVNVLH